MRVVKGIFILVMMVSPLLVAQCMKPLQAGILPVTTESAGGGGSYWQTDVIITDAGTPARAVNDVELWVWVHGANNVMRSKYRHVNLAPGQTMRIPRVLDWIGDVPYGSGELYILNFNATYPVIVNGRLYNTGSAARGDLQPGFGQGLPFLPYSVGMGSGESQLFPVPLDPNEARINVGLVNTGWGTAQVRVSLYNDLGSEVDGWALLRSETITLIEQEVRQFQINHPANIDLSGYAPGYVKIEDLTGDWGTIYPYVSIVDNVRIGDGQPTSDPYFLFGIN